jgi:radical SAM protein with 4Fe4S-binding SPASM domain
MANERLLLQWHITEKCNLRCKHCYQECFTGEDLPISVLSQILDEYLEFLDEWNQRRNGNFVRGHINITGGEPFLRADFFDFLDLIRSKKEKISFAILTNGTLLNHENVSRLKGLKPAFVQLSVEGNETIHNDIRGVGNFKKVTEAIKLLKSVGIKTYLSFTANNLNYNYFKDVALLGRKYGVDKVWADRLVPCNQEADNCRTLSVDQAYAFFKLMEKERKRGFLYKKINVEMARALMFQETGGFPYHCSAGDTLLALLPNGEIYPCRRLPLLVGNVLEQSFHSIYFENERMLQLRQGEVAEGCEKCSFHPLCKGGAKCISFATTGNFSAGDPACKYLSANILKTI